jgi:hypothetical protein
MSKELEAVSYLVETAIYGNKEDNRGKIFEAENTIKQALEQKEQLEKELERYKQGEKFNNEIANITNEHNIEIIREQAKELEEIKIFIKSMKIDKNRTLSIFETKDIIKLKKLVGENDE